MFPEHLPSRCRGQRGQPADRPLTLREAEQAHLRAVLREHHGSRKDLAQLLGISERALYRKLSELR